MTAFPEADPWARSSRQAPHRPAAVRPAAASAQSPCRFYRATLPPSERADYDALLKGLMRGERAVALPGHCDEAAAKRLLDALKLDNPELFSVGGLLLAHSPFGRGKALVEPIYRIPADEARMMREKLSSTTDGIVGDVRGRAEPEQLRALHDWLIARFSYGEGAGTHAHEATGALLFGGGVCESMAKALKYLCDRCGIPCIVATGRTRGNPALSDGARRPEPHAWNLVRLAAEAGTHWYHVDATFDAALSTSVARYDYFCLSDEEVDGDCEPDGAAYPPCPHPFGFYRRIGRFADSRRALEQLVHEAKAAGENPVVFQLPRIEGADEAFFQELAAAAGRELAPHPLRPLRINVARNRSRMVFQVEVEPPRKRPRPALPRR